MELRRGIPLAVAPRFQNRLAWIDRLQINGGVEVTGECIYPRGDWRPPGDADLALLLADGEAAASSGAAGMLRERARRRDAVLPGAHAGLLKLPAHLRRQWWVLPDGGEKRAVDDHPYRAFVESVIEFLRFKLLPLPSRCRVDVVVSRPGQRATEWRAAAGWPRGLGESPEEMTHARASAPPVAVINLGDEATHFVLLNLAPAAMAAMLGLPWPGDDARAASSELAGRFLATLPTYPLIRVRLEPARACGCPAMGSSTASARSTSARSTSP